MKKQIVHKVVFLFSIFFLALSCNQGANDLPDEDYSKLFGDEDLPPPDFGYETMPKLACEPAVSKEEYIYPGKEIADKRNYTVTVKFYFKETKRVQDDGPASSQVMLRFINENKELEILKTYKDIYEDGDQADFENGKEYVRTFRAQSGFPIYLGIFGGGYDVFEMKSSIQAVSDDGLIVTPLIQYETKTNVDGFSDDFSYCEKIILP